MNYVIAENYLCFLALLEMVIYEATGLKITQRQLAEEFGIIVPYGCKININNIMYSYVENDLGVMISEKRLQTFFDKNGIGLRIKYIDAIHINELDIDVRFGKYLREKKYVILAYSYGMLYNKFNHSSLGHVALLEEVRGEDIIQIYDPGPDEAGVKEISILRMYDAMRKKGGLYIIDKSEET
ncbi:MAG: hypothetical protein Q4D51_10535 [Eubacteriales bacterium]|nr:hypothetical protein [Eubacteriales bacterium]